MDLSPSNLKDILKSLFGGLYEPIRNYVLAPAWGAITVMFYSEEALFWLYLVTALIIALPSYAFYYAKGKGVSPASFFKFVAPRKIFLHRSSLVDYKFYFVNTFVLNIIYGAAILGAALSAQFFSGHFRNILEWIFGGTGPQWEPTLFSRATYSALMLLAFDFGKFLGHMLEHKSPFLWEFHKVHHSAEVLTPITNYRNHPIDKIFENFFPAVFSGVISGVYVYLYSGWMTEYTVLNVSALLLFYLLVVNLRHSHIWISYGRSLSHIFSSPAMHQIHHSAAEKHFDKNYGFMFSIWDYLAGSLYIPKERENLYWGLYNEDQRKYDSVWKLYTRPFVEVFSGLKRRMVFGSPKC
jgi:sterol desaturase/sphingolipid hydroxylase (fatty acid hydroxylase superfamily)